MGASGIWLKTDENPDGTDGKIFEGIKAGIPHDRYTFFKLFLDNLDLYGGTRVSEPAWQASLKVAVGASPYATYEVADALLIDFRLDLAKIDVPMLVVHGTADRVLPSGATAERRNGSPA